MLLLFTVHSTAQTIESIASPRVWLRSDMKTFQPGRWQDESGNQFNAIASAGESPELEGTLNYNKTLVFDDGKNYMTVPFSLEGLSELTVITVFQSADTTERGIWGAENAPLRNANLTTRKVTGPDSVVDDYGRNEIFPVIHTVVQNWKKSVVTGDSAWLALGSSGKETQIDQFNGSIAEFLVFDKTLGFLERRQIETYLAIKYGISSPGNYVNSAENVVWHGEENADYSNRITGLGRDDIFGLNQKQAKSALDTTDLLAISAGELTPFNDMNTARINNRDFLVWGDNARELRADTSRRAGRLSILERKWLMDVSGETANQISTNVLLDISQLPRDSLGYWLVIDRSGSGNFTTDNLEYILPDSVSSDSIAYFSDVQWDTDLSGKDMFGFANAKDLFAAVRVLKEPLCTDPNSGKIAIEVIGGSNPVEYKMTAKEFSRQWLGKSYSEQEGLAAGRYAVSIKDAGGDVFARDFLLTMPDALTIDLGKDQSIASGEEVGLDATILIPDSVMVSYFWEGNNGFKSAEGKVTVSEPGLYRVTVTNEDGCEFGDEVVLSGSAIQKFLVFPSVTFTGQFSIGISLEEANNVSVSIYDSKGNLYTTVDGQSSPEYLFKGQINEPGMYMIVLKTSGGIETRKLIVN